MAECWICGRAMVTEPSHLPWPICRRARCRHARDDIQNIMAYERTRSEYSTLAKYA